MKAARAAVQCTGADVDVDAVGAQIDLCNVVHESYNTHKTVQWHIHAFIIIIGPLYN